MRSSAVSPACKEYAQRHQAKYLLGGEAPELEIAIPSIVGSAKAVQRVKSRTLSSMSGTIATRPSCLILPQSKFKLCLLHSGYSQRSIDVDKGGSLRLPRT